MRKLLIHVGTGKTGTTSIQRSLVAAQRRGQLGPVCYPVFSLPKLRLANPHSVLGYLYKPDNPPRAFRSKDGEDRLKPLLPAIRRELEEQLRGNDNVILSTEYLGGLSRRIIREFRADLAQYAFDDVLIVVYVRNPADYYLSLASQAVRASHTINDPRRYRYPFRRTIANWSEVFGRIEVRPFERALLHEQCVVQDFLKVSSGFFGHELQGIRVHQANESLSAEACVILQRYRKLFHGDTDHVPAHDSSRLLRILMESRAALPQTAPRLRRGVRDVIAAQHREDLTWLRSELGIDFLGDADDAPGAWNPSSDEIQVGDIMESREDIVASLLLHVLHAVLQAPKEAGTPREPAGT